MQVYSKIEPDTLVIEQGIGLHSVTDVESTSGESVSEMSRSSQKQSALRQKTNVLSTLSKEELFQSQEAITKNSLSSQSGVGDAVFLSSMKPDAPLKIPTAITLQYQVFGQRSGQPWDAGLGRLEWDMDGDTYSIRLLSPHYTGKLRTQISVGVWSTEKGLQPNRFSDRQRSEQATHFQRTDGQNLIRFSSNVPSTQMQDGAQDRLSVIIQLAAIISGRIHAGLTLDSSVMLQVADTRNALVWLFDILPTDAVDEIYLLKRPMHPYDGQWELWLSSSINYLPNRWRVTLHGGDYYEYRRDY
jgi:hypothetical protein